ncbi:SPOR domain-containing protein [Halosquirtibacter xylanolyticus]|uniref:SPOR domain-containing protein n=1 Tax=Halosquirtibacter xylanolyticus TaxID=3374599 RepID=UPI0037495123|nr:SPOR domain-containing protein [Prolixibacteraceae bacterium]
MKRIFSLFAIVFSVTFWGCKEKKVKEVPKEVPVIEEVVTEVVTPIEETIEVEETVVIRGVNLKDRYFIIVGSYNIYNNAEVLKTELIKLGYSPVVFMQDENGQFKVAIESFQSLKQAENEMSNLMKGKKLLKHSWIFKRKGEIKPFNKNPI